MKMIAERSDERANGRGIRYHAAHNREQRSEGGKQRLSESTNRSVACAAPFFLGNTALKKSIEDFEYSSYP
jgi:hypothetical protein